MEDSGSSNSTINLKWGKQTFKDVSLNFAGGFDLFQAQIYSLTTVPPERQKILYKGKQIKELDSTVMKAGATFLLIGAAEETVKSFGDELDIKELEPQSTAEKPQDTPEDPDNLIILVNLGNTCYLNATIQFMRCIPELKSALISFPTDLRGTLPSDDPNNIYSISMTLALKELFKALEETKGPRYSPVSVLRTLQMVAPNFAVKDKHGGLMQQDANECWTVMIKMIQSKLTPLGDDSEKHSSFIEQYMMGKFTVESKCMESDEPSTTVQESFLQLTCFISQEVKFMASGLRLSLQEELNKYNDLLKRDAKYTRTYKITRLPAYLTVHFMRFYYKEKVNMNTKILREVKFPLMFDAYEFCSDDLKKKLDDMREKFRLDEECYDEKDRRVIIGNKDEHFHPYSFPDDSGSNNSGYYDLRAIITHKGRTSQAGHYVCWVKRLNSFNSWVKIDDDRIDDIRQDEIPLLAGGSDINTAYMLLYGPRYLKRRDDEGKSTSSSNI